MFEHRTVIKFIVPEQCFCYKIMKTVSIHLHKMFIINTESQYTYTNIIHIFRYGKVLHLLTFQIKERKCQKLENESDLFVLCFVYSSKKNCVKFTLTCGSITLIVFQVKYTSKHTGK